MKRIGMISTLLLLPALSSCSTYISRSGQDRAGVLISTILIGTAVSVLKLDSGKGCSQP